MSTAALARIGDTPTVTTDVLMWSLVILGVPLIATLIVLRLRGR